jgi:hypothetical protein
VGGSCENWEGRTCSRNITSDPMSSQFSCEEEILCHGTNSVTIVEHNFFAVTRKKYWFFLNGCNVRTVAGGVFSHISGLRETTYNLFTVQAL